jgi:hypothetical protein
MRNILIAAMDFHMIIRPLYLEITIQGRIERFNGGYTTDVEGCMVSVILHRIYTITHSMDYEAVVAALKYNRMTNEYEPLKASEANETQTF